MPWTPYLSAIKWVVGLALLTGWTWVVYDYAGNRADIAIAKAEQEAAEARVTLADERTAFSEYARIREHDHAEQLAAAAYRYEQERDDAQQAADAVIADLRAGTVRLQERWRGCPAVPGTGATAGQPDAAADDRSRSAAAIVRAAAECDAQVRGLQRVIRADRGLTP